jgi:hypothetical protein
MAMAQLLFMAQLLAQSTQGRRACCCVQRAGACCVLRAAPMHDAAACVHAAGRRRAEQRQRARAPRANTWGGSGFIRFVDLLRRFMSTNCPPAQPPGEATSKQCQGLTLRGDRCTRSTANGFCFQHRYQGEKDYDEEAPTHRNFQRAQGLLQSADEDMKGIDDGYGSAGGEERDEKESHAEELVLPRTKSFAACFAFSQDVSLPTRTRTVLKGKHRNGLGALKSTADDAARMQAFLEGKGVKCAGPHVACSGTSALDKEAVLSIIAELFENPDGQDYVLYVRIRSPYLHTASLFNAVVWSVSGRGSWRRRHRRLVHRGGGWSGDHHDG